MIFQRETKLSEGIVRKALLTNVPKSLHFSVRNKTSNQVKLRDSTGIKSIIVGDRSSTRILQSDGVHPPICCRSHAIALIYNVIGVSEESLSIDHGNIPQLEWPDRSRLSVPR